MLLGLLKQNQLVRLNGFCPSLHTANDRIVYECMSAKNTLDIVGCLFLLMFGIQVFTTIKAHRGLSSRAIRQMAQVSMGGVKALLLFGGVAGLASALLQPVLSDWIPPFPPLLVLLC